MIPRGVQTPLAIIACPLCMCINVFQCASLCITLH